MKTIEKFDLILAHCKVTYGYYGPVDEIKPSTAQEETLIKLDMIVALLELYYCKLKVSSTLNLISQKCNQLTRLQTHLK